MGIIKFSTRMRIFNEYFIPSTTTTTTTTTTTNNNNNNNSTNLFIYVLITESARIQTIAT
jgi:hypothetical protein